MFTFLMITSSSVGFYLLVLAALYLDGRRRRSHGDTIRKVVAANEVAISPARSRKVRQFPRLAA
jgi:hypothetical protein